MNGRTNVTVGTSGELQVALDPPNNFVLTSGNNQVLISWEDPKNKYATPEGETAQDPQQLIAVWQKTVLIRKANSAPNSMSDGTVVVSSDIRNQYQSTAYIDNGVVNDTLYYYAAYAVNEDNIASEPALSSVTPKGYEPVLENNTWTQIKDAATKGLASSMWEIGDTKNIRANGRSVAVAILDFNHDDKSDGSGKAPITFGTLSRVIDDVWGNNQDWEDSSDSDFGYNYSKTQLRDRLVNTVYPSMDEDLRNCIVPVTKQNYYIDDDRVKNKEDTADPLFLFDIREMDCTKEMLPNLTLRNNFQYPYFSTTSRVLKSYRVWLRAFQYNGYGYSSYEYVTNTPSSYNDPTDYSGFHNIMVILGNVQGGNRASVTFGFCI